MNDKRRLQDKVAVVTGGAHGIGRAIAELFAEEEAAVFIFDIDQKAGRAVAARLQNAGLSATFVACDVSSAKEVARCIKAAAARTGRVDVLCNNAAFLSRQWHGSRNATELEWKKSIEVSLLGAQHCTREVLPFMMRQKAGSVINISSVQGLVAGRESVAYTTIKHALIGFTRSVACDYGSHNIRCNAVCPGAISTRISPKPGSALHRRQISKSFLGRVGRPFEVAQAALFLASDESSFVTGAVLPVDGGWTAM